MIRVGVLSDTHISQAGPEFRAKAAACFADCSMILHAGDLTELAILEVFGDKEVHAVAGNMCGSRTRAALPSRKTIQVGGFTIGLMHSPRYSYDPEELLLEEFPEADCIVYGHTHRPVARRIGKIVMLNPGSFTAGGGTYGVIEINDQLRAFIREVPSAR